MIQRHQKSGSTWRVMDFAKDVRKIVHEQRVAGLGGPQRTEARHATEVAILVRVLNRMLELGEPECVRLA